MTRLGLVVTLICLLAWTAGCRMCASEFDYCGPTVSGGSGKACGLNTPRAGSILNGASAAVYEGQTIDEADAVYEQEAADSTEQLGSDAFRAPIMPSQLIEGQRIDGVIISVEDRKLENAAPQASQSAPASTSAAGSATAAPQALESTLRQPTPAPKKADWSAK